MWRLFREAIRFTSAETAFSTRLIEKDYFCTLMLSYFSTSAEMVFKGGTCLAKVHAGFYRLSEDLDFAISMPAVQRQSFFPATTGLCRVGCKKLIF